MKEELDKLAKNLARGMSRRQALWAFGSGIGVAAVGLFSARRSEATPVFTGKPPCFDYCASAFGEGTEEFGLCMAASASCRTGYCISALNSTGLCIPINF